MYLDFLAGLLLVGFVYSLLLGVPIGLLLSLSSRWTDARGDYWSHLAQHAVFGVLYAGVIAVLVRMFVTRAPVEHTWLYVLTGFAVVFGSLASNAKDKVKLAAQTREAVDRAIATGAGLGHLTGIAAYFLIYFVPELFLVIPGGEPLLNWTLGVSQWLIGFGLVQVAILALAGWWLLNTGGALLTWGGMAAVAGYDAVFSSSEQESEKESYRNRYTPTHKSLNRQRQDESS